MLFEGILKPVANFKHEIIKFIIIGLITVLIDYQIYKFLFEQVGWIITLSKAIAYLVGTAFSYIANRFWTFNTKTNLMSFSMIRHLVLYLFALIINISANSLVLSIFGSLSLYHESYAFTVAFVFATTISASINFIGMKFWVFHNK